MVRPVIQVLVFLLKGYVGFLMLMGAVMVVSALVTNVAPVGLLRRLGAGSWAELEVLRLRFEQRLVLLDFALGLLLAAWVVAMRDAPWPVSVTAGVLLVAALLTAWRRLLVSRVASLGEAEAEARVAAREYSDALTAGVFLTALMGVAVFGGEPLLKGVLLLACAGAAGAFALNGMINYHQAMDPAEVVDE